MEAFLQRQVAKKHARERIRLNLSIFAFCTSFLKNLFRNFFSSLNAGLQFPISITGGLLDPEANDARCRSRIRIHITYIEYGSYLHATSLLFLH